MPDSNIKWPPEVHDYNERFTKLLSNIKRRHDPVVTTIAQGIIEFKRESKSKQIDRSLQTFLDRFYMSRIGRLSGFAFLGRQLIGRNSRRNTRPHRSTHCAQPPGTARGELRSFLPSPWFANLLVLRIMVRNERRVLWELANPVAQSESSARRQTFTRSHGKLSRTRPTSARSTLGCSRVLRCSSSARKISTLCMFRAIWYVLLVAVVGSGLLIMRAQNHMLFEVLKNSLRAVVEKHGVDCDEYPPVKVIVAEGNEDITIKISDEGGGIPRSAVPLVWTFMCGAQVPFELGDCADLVPRYRYTTASPENLEQDFQGTDFKAPMAGFGASSSAYHFWRSEN